MAITTPESVKGYCAKCNTYIGEFYNSWLSVTKSYHLPTFPGSYEISHLKSSGVSQAALGGTELTGAEVSSMFCETCDLTLAIECTKSPDHRSIFRDQLFFKLPKIILRHSETGATVTPHMDDITINQLQLSGQRSQMVHAPAPASRESSPPQAPSDMAESIHRNLVDTVKVEAEEQSRQPSQAPSSPTPSDPPAPLDVDMVDADDIDMEPASPQAHGRILAGSSLHFEAELRRQAHQIDNIESILSSLQGSVRTLQEDVQSLRYRHSSANDGILDTISETITNISSKVAMVDSCHLAIQLLKRKVARIEEGGSGTASDHTASPASFSTISASVIPRPSFTAQATGSASRRDSLRLSSRRSPPHVGPSPSKRPRTNTIPVPDDFPDDYNLDEDEFLESHSGLLDSFRAAPSKSPPVGSNATGSETPTITASSATPAVSELPHASSTKPAGAQSSRPSLPINALNLGASRLHGLGIGKENTSTSITNTIGPRTNSGADKSVTIRDKSIPQKSGLAKVASLNSKSRHSLPPSLENFGGSGGGAAREGLQKQKHNGDAMKEMFPNGVDARKKQFNPANHFQTSTTSKTAKPWLI